MNTFVIQEEQVVEQALQIVQARFNLCNQGELLSSRCAKRLAALKLSVKKQEVFAGLLLDSQHRVIQYVEFFQGTINACAVYPREVVRICLDHNAAAIIFLHNHPSGICEPSVADKAITESLCKGLTLFDIQVLDHLIVGSGEPFSFAENCLMPIVG